MAELRVGEEVVALSVPMPGVVVPVPGAGNAELSVLPSSGIPDALPSHIAAVFIPSPATILIVEGDSKVPRREWAVWVLGSAMETFLFASGPLLLLLFVLHETFTWLSVAVVASLPSNAITVQRTTERMKCQG